MRANLTRPFILISVFAFLANALVRRRPNVVIQPAAEPDNIDVERKLNRIEAALREQRIRGPPAEPFVEDEVRMQNALEKEMIHEEEEKQRQAEESHIQSEVEDAKTKGEMEGAEKESMNQVVKTEQLAGAELAAEQNMQKQAEQEEEKLVEEQIKEDESEEAKLAAQDQADEIEKSALSEPEAVKNSDLAFEDETRAALSSANAVEKDVNKLNNEVDKKQNVEAEAELEASKVPPNPAATEAAAGEAAAGETAAGEAAAGEAPPGAGPPSAASEITEGGKPPSEGCATGFIDHPCPCIEELMKEPCASASKKEKLTCESILEKGVEAKIIKHKDMTGGPIVVTKEGPEEKTPSEETPEGEELAEEALEAEETVE